MQDMTVENILQKQTKKQVLFKKLREKIRRKQQRKEWQKIINPVKNITFLQTIDFSLTLWQSRIYRSN